MKTAICLSGHMRSYQKTVSSLNDFIIKPLQADVFIHTWEHLGWSYHVDAGSMRVATIFQNKEIEKLYKPKAFLIEKMVKNLGARYRKLLVDKRSADAIVNMFYKIYQADITRQKYEKFHGKYDLVIRVRPDLYFEEPINKDDIEDAVNNDVLYLPNCGHYDGLNDQFAFGNSEVMKIYSYCFMDIPNIAVDIPFKPEVLLRQYLVKNKIPMKFSDVNYVIKRLNGDIFDNRKHSPGPPNIDLW
jgi:hypothetical protein